MNTIQHYIKIIRQEEPRLKDEFGIKCLGVFGSMARGEAREDSDLDIFVDMDAKMFLIIRLKRFLENLTRKKIDIVRLHEGMNPLLKSQIDKDSVYVIGGDALSMMGRN